MDRLKPLFIIKTTAVLILLIMVLGCGKNQNAFLPNVQVNISLTSYELNFIEISGNSIEFLNQGYNGNGVIISCSNPDPNQPQYYAYDATCPYETDHTGVVVLTAVKNYASPPYTIFSSGFMGTCNKCGSTFNLMNGGQVTGGPAAHFLENYNVLSGNGSITITN